MSDTKKIECIKLDSVIQIGCSGAFYQRLHKWLITYSQQKTAEEFSAIMQHLKNGEPRDEYEYNLITLLMMVHEVESAAKAQDKLEYKDFPAPDKSQS